MYFFKKNKEPPATPKHEINKYCCDWELLNASTKTENRFAGVNHAKLEQSIIINKLSNSIKIYILIH